MSERCLQYIQRKEYIQALFGFQHSITVAVFVNVTQLVYCGYIVAYS